MQRVFILALLAGAAFADGSVQLTAGASAQAITDNIFSLLGGISVSSNVNTQLSFSAAVNLNLNFAGSASGGKGLSLSLSGLLTAPVQLYFQATPAATITVTVTPSTLASLLTGSVQLNLFLATTGASGSASLGAVPYTVSNGQYTYTLNLDGTKQAVSIAPFDLSTCASAGGSSSNQGSASFNYASSFYPVALGHSFNLQTGTQYAFGDNLQVTPSSGNGNFQAIFNGAFGASQSGQASVAGPSNSNGFFNGYYTFSGSGNQNVLQWKSAVGNTFAFANGSAAISAQAWASANANNGIAWFKSSTGNTAANAWQKVSSSSSITASGQVAVSTTTGTYSQWTVGASNSGAAALSVAGLLIVGATLLSIVF